MPTPDFLQRLFTHRIIASLRANTAEMAVQSACAVIKGGLRIIEVPQSTPGAMRVIGDIRHQFGDEVIIGIGDVPSTEVADRAIKANAQFATLSYDNARVVEFCRKHHLFVIPAGATPREVALLAERGAPVVRVFPVSAFGGAMYVGHLRRALPNVHLLAAGGIDLSEITTYFRAGASIVAIGSGLFPPKTDGPLDVEDLTKRAQQLTAMSVPQLT